MRSTALKKITARKQVDLTQSKVRSAITNGKGHHSRL